MIHLTEDLFAVVVDENTHGFKICELVGNEGIAYEYDGVDGYACFGLPKGNWEIIKKVDKVLIIRKINICKLTEKNH